MHTARCGVGILEEKGRSVVHRPKTCVGCTRDRVLIDEDGSESSSFARPHLMRDSHVAYVYQDGMSEPEVEGAGWLSG